MIMRFARMSQVDGGTRRTSSDAKRSSASRRIIETEPEHAAKGEEAEPPSKTIYVPDSAAKGRSGVRITGAIHC